MHKHKNENKLEENTINVREFEPVTAKLIHNKIYVKICVSNPKL